LIGRLGRASSARQSWNSFKGFRILKTACSTTRALVGLAIVLFFGACVPSFAQDITGSIVGTVTDPSGAVVGNAKVTVFSIDRQRDARVIMTDSSGNFAAPKLDIGKYRVTVESPGFKKAVRDEIVLTSTTHLRSRLLSKWAP